MAKTITDAEIKEARSRQAVVAGEPGYGLGLAGFIVSFFVSFAGLIMSAIALKQSKKIGKKNPFALAGLIIGIVFTAFGVLWLIAIVAGTVWFVGYCNDNPSECRENGSYNGSHYYRDGETDGSEPMNRTY